MLESKRRLKRALYPTGRPLKILRGKFISISTFPFNGETKFFVTISKKIAKTAVLRNKIRRLCYGSVEETLDNVKRGYIVRLSVYNTSFNQNDLKKEINELLLKTDIMPQS